MCKTVSILPMLVAAELFVEGSDCYDDWVRVIKAAITNFTGARDRNQ